MKITLLAAIAALSLAATGTTFADSEGNGPDFPAYNAGVAEVESHAILGTGPTFATRQVPVQPDVAESGSAYGQQSTALPAQHPETLSGYAAAGHPQG
jgi:hypothetical protein